MCLSRDEVREHFENCGLRYGMLKEDDFILLKAFLSKEFRLAGERPTTPEMESFRVNDNKSIYRARPDRTLSEAFIRMMSDYWYNREAVSFNKDGFIGFAGWASDKNVQPVLMGFVKWCDYLTGQGM